jgi:2-keto-3-deoxygluconate permease
MAHGPIGLGQSDRDKRVLGMRRRDLFVRELGAGRAMKIYKFINKFPGGLMVVPMFIGMIINTFFPTLLKIGGYTEALSGAGYNTVLGMYLFTVGTKMTLRTAPRMLRRGFGIMFVKVGVATLIALSVAKFFGGDVFGLSTLAILVAMSDTNGGMFMALTSAMGDKEDVGTYVPQSIETGPFLTMIILVGAGLADIPYLTMVSVIAPIFAGALLGNLDEELREFFASKEPLIVPFMGFTLGQNINLNNVVDGGLQGIALGIFVLIVTGIVCIFADKFLGGSGIAGAAASSTAGNSTAVPKAIAAADPTYAAIAPIATVQVTASFIVTAVLTPLLTAWMARRVQARRAAAGEAPVTPPTVDPGALGNMP